MRLLDVYPFNPTAVRIPVRQMLFWGAVRDFKVLAGVPEASAGGRPATPQKSKADGMAAQPNPYPVGVGCQPSRQAWAEPAADGGGGGGGGGAVDRARALSELFDAADADRNGSVSLSEFRAMHSSAASEVRQGARHTRACAHTHLAGAGARNASEMPPA